MPKALEAARPKLAAVPDVDDLQCLLDADFVVEVLGKEQKL